MAVSSRWGPTSPMASPSDVIPHTLSSEFQELALLCGLSGELPIPALSLASAAAAASFSAAAPLVAPSAPAPPAAPASLPPPPPYATEREVRRLEAAVREISEVNERIMAQNISLLADLEAAQRTVRELRAGKDALAVQLRRCREALAEKEKGEGVR